MSNTIYDYIDVQFAEMLPDGFIVYSTGDIAKLLYANRRALDIFDCDSLEDMQAFCGENYLNFFHPEDYKFHIDTIRLEWTNEKSLEHHVQYRVITKSETIKMLNDSGRVLNIPDYPKCFICILSEVNHQIGYMSDGADSLTGLLSLGQFKKYCENFFNIRENRDSIQSYHIAYFNIRRFKEYNVEFGAKKGDLVLQTMGRILEKWFAAKVVARIGGDQFVAISPAHEMDVNIRKIIEEFFFEYARDGLSVDVGIYPLKDSQEDIHVACDLAKVACDSIHSSKENICIYNEALSKKLKISNYILHHLDEAIQNKYIQVYYQPVIRSMTGKLCGMEALARWSDPNIGFLSPEDFISVLEDNHMITKLDLYILEEICSDMRVAEEEGRALIPVSFNLSRMDFIDYDIYSEVESIVKRYNVPRDMINIEITESMVMGDADLFTREIARFRVGGYQVWMDDFGSGYSSLNILQDFKFDEIKLDMHFLTNLNEKSKTIVESIIMMAKKLGVQTLAEGVETQEQYEFLRNAGCEKMQGYLFGKPLPAKKLTELIDASEIQIEMHKWYKYYQEIGRVNIITNRAMALVEYNGKKFEYMFVNQAFKDVWKSLGVQGMETVKNVTNSETSPFGRQLQELRLMLNPGEASETVNTSVNGQYICLNIQNIAAHENHAIYNVEIINLTSKEERERQEELDNMYQMMYSLYDSMYLLRLDTRTFQTLIHGASSNIKEYKRFHETGKIDPILAGKIFIHPSEQEEYIEFCNIDTVMKRIKESDRGYVVRYFRTLTTNGFYIWKAHTLMYVPTVDGILYCSREAFFNQPGLIEKLMLEHHMNLFETENKGFYSIIQRGITESKTINMFWKDTNRRFIGVNESFLNSYGLSDPAEIIGKTDEEVGWHIENDPFRDDEIRVIERGELITNRIGTCIIKGVTHTILVNKEPLYEKGRIIGLQGSFIIIDELKSDENLMLNTNTRDSVTGLMSATTFTDYIIKYVESYRLNRENFAVIRMSFSSYFRISQTYGEKIMNEMLREIGHMITSRIGVHGSVARMFAGNFIILSKCQDKKVLQKIAEELVNIFENTHELAGYSVTLRPEKEVHFADEVNDIQRIIGIALGGTAIDIAERKDLEKLFLMEMQRKAFLIERYAEYFRFKFDANDINQILSVTEFQGAMLNSIAHAYISMHILNLEEDTYMKIWCMDYVEEVVKPYKSSQAALHKVIEVMMKPESQKEAYEFLDLSTLPERLKGKKVLHFDYSGSRTGWCRGQFIPVTYREDGKPKEALFIVQHIQEDKEKEEKLLKLSETDGLSQLYNHTSGEQYVNAYLEQGGMGMFCLLDIDNFKAINDNYSHAVGDKVIQGISQCMKKTFREKDILIRLGGDEFVVFAPGLIDPSICRERIARLHKNISELKFEEGNIKISVCIGMVIYDKKERNLQFEQLYRESDALMYEEKRQKSAENS